MSVHKLERFEQVIEDARQAGKKAAEARYAILVASARPGSQMIDECGTAILTLTVDGRSTLGKFLGSIGHSLPNLSIDKVRRRGGYTVHILGMEKGQEQSVAEAANDAALNVLERELGVKGYVQGYTG